MLGSLNINSGNYTVKGFEETTEPKQAIWGNRGDAGDGRSIIDTSLPNKKFMITLSIVGQTATTDLNSALRTLYETVVRADDPDDTLWLYHRPSADVAWTAIRKIKVLYADCMVPTDQKMWKALILDGIQLSLECEEAWRGTEIELTEVGADANVENADDTGRDNHWDINATLLEGDIPGFCRIEVASTHGNYSGWRIAQKKDFSSNLTLEFSGTADATASGGEFYSYSPGTTWGIVGNKTLTASIYYGLYRVFARVQDRAMSGGDHYLRIRWGTATAVDAAPNATSMITNDQHRVKPSMYTGDNPDSRVWVDVPLGMVDFRESYWKAGSYEPLYFSIQLQAKENNLPLASLYVDRLYLMPLDEGYLWAGRTDGASVTNDILIADSDSGKVFVVNSSGQIKFFPSLDGKPFNLDPHAVSTIRLFFLWEEGSAPSQNIIRSGGVDRQAHVNVFYIPRFL